MFRVELINLNSIFTLIITLDFLTTIITMLCWGWWAWWCCWCEGGWWVGGWLAEFVYDADEVWQRRQMRKIDRGKVVIFKCGKREYYEYLFLAVKFPKGVVLRSAPFFFAGLFYMREVYPIPPYVIFVDINRHNWNLFIISEWTYFGSKVLPEI